MFDALRTGRMMLKRRSEKVTYSNVRHVVENMTKREFRVEHLAQIKYLRPQAFDWQYIRTPSASNPLQMEIQLLLTFDRPTSSGAEGLGGGSVGRYSGAAELSEFRAQLEEHAKANPVDPETGKLREPVPQAPLPPRPTASGPALSRAGSLPLCGLSSPGASAGGSAAGCNAGLLQTASCSFGMFTDNAQVAGLAAGLGSPGSSMSSGMSAASPSMTRSRSRLGLLGGSMPVASLTPILEGNTPAVQQRAVTPQQQRPHPRASGSPKQMEAEVALEEAAEGPALELTQHQGSMTAMQPTAFGVAATVVRTPQSKGPRPAGLPTTPTSQQQPQSAGLARLHSLLSPAAMQKILEAEAAQVAQTPEAKRRAEMRRAVQLLPHGHELVRIIFGLQGPTVKPLTQVAQLMCERSTQRQGLAARDASNTLVAMARAVPEFLRIEDPRVLADGSARPRSVVISRAANINAVAAKLKALAADPDAAVQSIFERGGCGAADAGTRAASLGRAATGPIPESLAAGLKPRSLAQALEEDGAATVSGVGGPAATSNSGRAGGATACGLEMPPPTPSSRRRPPGLPLAPPSPMPQRCAQTPTRSGMVRGDRPSGPIGSILAAHGQAATAALAAPAPIGGGCSGSAASASDDGFLQKLCRTGAAVGTAKPAVAIKDCSNSVGGASPCESRGAGGDLGESEGQDGSGRTPSRVTGGARTPGRTAVQEEMLNSIRRSSAKRSCCKLLEDELGVGPGYVEDGEPVPRRLEESLLD
ncbi:hypothetical protein VOLCADRAFT_94831 [Volvox carteri f. nagariensis]|uniref:CDT1 Geminin-binding domain-containing protein n=1 Tax=Volvox carteri f. nagariensis TaxID=3068 RepID=D8U5W1_VOLCA|nr:uncharacterized protein VOLCADRAFT_94831 [Volvox carteri f. nagariensis]EFJ44755.1 hypothetical protein VOLCADRAFT_94831 [Volvox carteri f. nagariensis]|eukprot:XP_002954038.1 hypothetical protein VOLCADRAFT_94831 [Volvox carteri f. nagariensis]